MATTYRGTGAGRRRPFRPVSRSCVPGRGDGVPGRRGDFGTAARQEIVHYLLSRTEVVLANTPGYRCDVIATYRCFVTTVGYSSAILRPHTSSNRQGTSL